MSALRIPTTTGLTIDPVKPEDREQLVDADVVARCPDERAIAAGLVAGDRASLEAAFRRWADLVHGVARQRVGADAADDVTQQVFVQAWRTRSGFDPARGEVPGWLVGITRNVCRSHHRSRGRAPLVLVEDVEPMAPEADPGRDVEAGLLLADALRTLPDEQRHVVELSLLHDHTQQEVAQVLGLPLGTVKSRQRRGLLRLRKVLEGSA